MSTALDGRGVKHRETFDRGAPANYVAGLGRGAVGFTTRSDIGPARAPAAPEVNFGPAPEGYVAGRGRAMGALARELGETGGLGKLQQSSESHEEDLNESNFDEFSGWGGALFGKETPYDEDDQEADKIYGAVDDRMDSRRKRRREEKRLEMLKKVRQERPKAQEVFADLTADLKAVSESEWAAIPDSADSALKRNQKKRLDVFTPVPDTIIGARGTAYANALDPRASGTETPAVSGTTSTIEFSSAKKTIISMELGRIEDNVTGHSVVDPQGYLTSLNAFSIGGGYDVTELKRARLLLKSIITTNPKNPQGWIAAARLEEQDGKLVAARKLLKGGCDACPESQDIWLECARLQTPENAMVILWDAVKRIPTSEKLWSRLADLENRVPKKKTILRRALEQIPTSINLWKMAIELEEQEDAIIMLQRAVECVPHSVEMWLTLARLETYENARDVLNRARRAVPTEPRMWITAAKLEESQQHGSEIIERIIEKGISVLQQYQVVMDREKWLQEAETAEFEKYPLTCQAIVKATISMGVEPEDRLRTWVDDAQASLSRNAVETARAIYGYALTVFPGKKSIWQQACMLEKEHGTPVALEQMLKKAVNYCPQAETLWLMAAKQKWQAREVAEAREILTAAFKANRDSEQIWLAAVKLEWEENQHERARLLLEKARKEASTPRLWLKSAKLERELGNVNKCLELLEDAIKRYAEFPKFYMMAGQACEEVLKDDDRARKYYQTGIQRCPTNVPLRKLDVYLHERTSGFTKARSQLDLARLRIPKNPELWVETVRLERRAGNEKAAVMAMAKALQECPDSGLLWAEDILTCPRAEKRAKSTEALKIKKCEKDPHVILAVARYFDSEKKYSKAKTWYERVLTIDPDMGDAWGYYYASTLRLGTTEQQEDVLKRCLQADPAHGELWTSVSKKVENWRCDKPTVLKKVVAKITEGGKGGDVKELELIHKKIDVDN